jgi:hypothetical protein
MWSGVEPELRVHDEREDAIAADTDPLAWYLTRDARYSASGSPSC